MAVVNDPMKPVEASHTETHAGSSIAEGRRQLEHALDRFAQREKRIAEVTEQAHAVIDQLCREMLDQEQRGRADVQIVWQETGRSNRHSRDKTEIQAQCLTQLEAELRLHLRDHREAYVRAMEIRAAISSRADRTEQVTEATDAERTSRTLQDLEKSIVECDQRIRVLDERLATKELGLRLRIAALRQTCDELGDALRAKRLEQTSAIRRVTEDVAVARQEHARTERLLQDQIDARQSELARVYGSVSWKLTHPLRAANLWLGSVRRAVRAVVAGIIGIPRSAVRRAGVVVLNRLRRNPRLHAKVVSRLGSFPLVLSHARAFARNNRPAPAQRGVKRFREADYPRRRAQVSDGTEARERKSNPFEWAGNDGDSGSFMIFVDHTLACPVNTGVQRVARQLTRALLELGERPIPVKWDSLNRRLMRASPEDLRDLALWNGPLFDNGLHRGSNDPRKLAVDDSYVSATRCSWIIVPEVTHINFHGRDTTYELIQVAKKLNLKTGFVFHDAIPLRREEFASLVDIHSEYMRNLLLADLVWPVSRWAGTDLVSYWSSSESAEISTMPAVEVLPESGAVPGIARSGRTEEPPDTLILSVGTIEPRKNQVTLIRAFEEIRRRRPELEWRLALVGNLHPLVADEVRSAIERDSAIMYLGHVSDEELTEFYQQCAFSVFPSVEEGFGLPILESLWLGKPCICANFGAMAEVAEGGGCVAIDTRSVESVAEAIEDLIDKPERLRALAAGAINRALPTWRDYAQSVANSIRWQSSAATHLGTIYYWVDHTIGFYKNTGIQRVTRNLARALMELGVSVCPAKWDAENSEFVMPTSDELEYLHRWNGPAPTLWSAWTDPFSSPDGSWFVMPELPLHYARHGHAEILEAARAAGLKTAAIFYDAIPWKMLEIYPEHFSNAHGDYMEDLNAYDLVLAISEFSREDLVCHLGAKVRKLTGLDERIRAVALAGEFLESPRVVDAQVVPRDELVVLCVGTVEPRKNHLVLLDAFEEVVRSSRANVKLNIVGRSTDPDLERAVRNRIARSSRVTWNDDADDKALSQLYRQCDFTVFPSLEEGFGLPILESLWNGKPCICASFGAMSEVAAGGGCVAVDVRDSRALADAILNLVGDETRRRTLTEEAAKRRFKSWRDYAAEIAELMRASAMAGRQDWSRLAPSRQSAAHMGLESRHRPLLSVCITTSNRAESLAKCLENWNRIHPSPSQEVELIVCDDASTDHTHEVAKQYERRADFSYKQNAIDVGMLGNLSKAVQLARGKFIWVIGDDDLLMPGSLEQIVGVIQRSPTLSLLYLNHASSKLGDARRLTDLQAILRDADPVVPPGGNRFEEVGSLCAVKPDFFTKTGALVFRRDHALKAYSQNMQGRPFSTMLTSFPTSHYVLHNLMRDQGCWIGAPQVVLNVSSSRSEFASLEALERMPEAYDLAELRGGDANEIDRWRRHSLRNVEQFFGEIYRDDPLGNAEYFCPRRLVWRFNHLEEFSPIAERLARVYRDAYARSHPAAALPPALVFPRVPLA